MSLSWKWFLIWVKYTYTLSITVKKNFFWIFCKLSTNTRILVEEASSVSQLHAIEIFVSIKYLLDPIFVELWDGVWGRHNLWKMLTQTIQQRHYFGFSMPNSPEDVAINTAFKFWNSSRNSYKLSDCVVPFINTSNQCFWSHTSVCPPFYHQRNIAELTSAER